jgi:4-hydroxy 2-oxovalerate aldolase
VSYVLGIAASGKVKKIILAGFQGYNSDDLRQIEMDNTINLFKSNSKILISSITPTKYKVKIDSLYV